MRTVLVGCAMLFVVGCSKSETAAPVSPPVAALPAPSAPPPAVQKVAFQQDAVPSPLPGSPAVPAPATPAVPSPPPASPLTNLKPPANDSGLNTLAGQTPVTNAPTHSMWDTLGRVASQFTNRTATASNGSPSAASAAGSGVAGALAASDLSSDQITRGLKEALAKGLDHAVSQLGKDGGFLTNAAVRIPMPDKLKTVEKLMRSVGQDKMADDFVATMNHAAEKAVPAAAGVFADSLKQMTVSDAQSILQGPKDAATQYFRRTAGPQIQEKFKPIVADATAQTGATAAYKSLMDRASFASPFLKKESLDLDDYVTSQATDGLFKMVAQEEARIRENPVARTTDLLKSVFGSLGKGMFSH